MSSKKLEISSLNSQSRNKLIKANVSLSFVYKVIGVGINFLLIPITMKYLDAEQYGIWLTLLSILSWISLFDIGLGNGLRNKLSEALSKRDFNESRIYVSTAYASISVLVGVIWAASAVVIPRLNWTAIFNTQNLSDKYLIQLMFVVLSIFLLNFILSLYNQLFYAYQQASVTGLGQVLFSVLFMGALFVFKGQIQGSLLYLGTMYSLSMLISSVVLTVYFFINHKEVLPSIRFVRVEKVKDILNLGVQFFIIQIAGIVIFSTGNMIITQTMGPEHVTPYNIAFKLFNVFSVVFGILLSPLWSAYTEAYVKGDMAWIRKTLKKLNILMIPVTLIILIMVALSQFIIRIWVGPEIKVSYGLIGLTAIYTLISMWNNIYAFFLNGINRIKVQMYLAVLGGILNIPLSIYFVRDLGMGTSGVILGTIIALSFFAVVGPIQTYMIVKEDKQKI